MPYVHPPPDYHDALRALDIDAVQRVFRAPVSDRDYLHWDELRHRHPPDGLALEEWWLRLKLQREGRKLPMRDKHGVPATFSIPDGAMASLHLIDQRCAGEIAMDEVVTRDDQARRRYLVNSLMEEAIRSSQLEGATTSRRAAKQMLQSGREPRTRSEQMVLNNYRAMMFIRSDLGSTLTPQGVLDLHRVVTEGTLDDPTAAGRLQRPDEERVAVYERDGGRVLHVPPPASELPDRLEALCAFANGESTSDTFVHPVVRAVLLHYWLGYDHPFEDGNGRTARALFYWSMRRDGYWLVEYLSISRILREAPSKYSRAYLYAESDANDTTYFLLHHLQVIERAIEELHRYLRRKVAEVREVETLLRADDDLNHRQIALLGHAMRNLAEEYTFDGHARSHGVTHETARTDLTGLQRRGLLQRRRAGRKHFFVAVEDMADRLAAVAPTSAGAAR